MFEHISGGFVIQPRLTFDCLIDKMLFQHFMTEANFKDSSQCKTGELMTTMTSLSEETKWSYGVVRGAIKRLEERKYISVKTRSQKRGMVVKVLHYAEFQTLKKYEKTNKENDNQVTNKEQRKNNDNNNEKKPNVSSSSSAEAVSKTSANNENDKQATNEKQSDNKEIHNTITSFITSLNNININRTLKHYVDSASVQSVNLSSFNEIEIFIEFAFKLNTFPEGTSEKIVKNYCDMIRLTRQTCSISAKLLVKLIERMTKYNANQLNYALWLHHEEHDDKKENYTIGILRNTTDHDARRGLIKLKNKNGGVNHAVTSTSYDEYEFGF